MMCDPNLFMETVREKQRAINRKAELARLMREGQETQPPLAERMPRAMTEMPTSAGEHMREELPTATPR